MYALKYKNSEDKVVPLLSLYYCQILNYVLRNVPIMQINVSLHLKWEPCTHVMQNKDKKIIPNSLEWK